MTSWTECANTVPPLTHTITASTVQYVLTTCSTTQTLTNVFPVQIIQYTILTKWSVNVLMTIHSKLLKDASNAISLTISMSPVKHVFHAKRILSLILLPKDANLAPLIDQSLLTLSVLLVQIILTSIRQLLLVNLVLETETTIRR